MTNAVASSSKRAASGSASTTPAKRPRASSSRADSPMDDDELVEIGDEGDDGNLDNSARAKTLRKEARTIRNRESAQRSRNQRKAHLAYLEVRVAELEKENRALRSGETPPPARSAEREASPAQSVISLANDLGIPHEIVSSSGGVNLATVAPPPADLDVKPVVTPASPMSTNVQATSSYGDMSIDSIQAENAALRERVGLLENLVKQVVALSNLGGIPSAQAPTQVAAPPASPAFAPPQSFEWDAILNANADNQSANARMNATLSPPMFPIQPLEVATELSIPSVNPALPSNTDPGPAAGEDSFTFGSFGDEFGAFGHDGQGSDRVGQTSGHVQPAFQGFHTQAFDLEYQVAAHEIGYGEENRGEASSVAAEWDEGMRMLLEDLEGRGVVAEGEVETERQRQREQTKVDREVEGERAMAWMFGQQMSNGATTALGLAV